MARDRWWNKDRSQKHSIRVLLGLLAALIIGVVVAVTVTTSDHDARMAHQPIEALMRVHVAGSVRRTSIVSTGCGGYVSPTASRTDWTKLSPAEVQEQTATQVQSAGWTTAPEPDDGFGLDGMTMTVAAEPTADGGSRVTTSIAAPDSCYSDQ